VSNGHMTSADVIARSTHAWRLMVVTATALGVGVATSYLQGVLPASANFLANSGAVWTVVAFLLALWAASRFWVAAVAGALGLLGEVMGYYAIAAPLRHIATSPAERVLWVAAALVIGPVVGAAAHVARHGQPLHRAAVVGAVAGVVIGEGVYAWARLSHPLQGLLEVVIGAFAVVGSAVMLGRSLRDRVACVAAAAVISVLVFLAYTVG
jgi:hypothetical protein